MPESVGRRRYDPQALGYTEAQLWAVMVQEEL